jgi:hypothetical protein
MIKVFAELADYITIQIGKIHTLTFDPVVLHTSRFNDNGVCRGWVKTSDQNVIL